MIAADFLRDPTGIRIGHALPNGPTAGSYGPFLFGCNSAQAARHLHGSKKLDSEGRLWMMRRAPSISIVAPPSPPRQHNFARAGRLCTLCTIEIEVAVRLGWSGMALAIDDPPWRRSCRS